jgi:hypothetical protein
MANAIYSFVLGVLEFLCFMLILFVPVPAFVAAIVLLMAAYFGIGLMKGWLQSMESRKLGEYILGKFVYPAFLALFLFSSPSGAIMVAGFAAIAMLDSVSAAVYSYYVPYHAHHQTS